MLAWIIRAIQEIGRHNVAVGTWVVMRLEFTEKLNGEEHNAHLVGLNYPKLKVVSVSNSHASLNLRTKHGERNEMFLDYCSLWVIDLI